MNVYPQKGVLTQRWLQSCYWPIGLIVLRLFYSSQRDFELFFCQKQRPLFNRLHYTARHDFLNIQFMEIQVREIKIRCGRGSGFLGTEASADKSVTFRQHDLH